MLRKIIYLPFIFFILSCASLTTENRSVDGCKVKNEPFGSHGRVEIRCPQLSFAVLYDNIPDGRDALILGVEGISASKSSQERIEPYRINVGEEILEGWALKEEWQLRAKGRAFTLKGFEYFVNGGTSCYEEEEGYNIELEIEGKSITLTKFYQEDTDCGGA